MASMPMDRWRRIDELLAQCLELDAADRLDFLRQACGADTALLADVSALLEHAADAEHLIGESAQDFAADIVASIRHEAERDETLPANTRIGPYRLIREVGRGGMGTVYLAERADGEFNKRVALKLVRRGMDTDEIVSRFRRERRILASLEHPNIARLYDGGASDDGRPYLVMELVEGQPIIEWCDKRQLGIEARLKLFLTVCDAVQYAHQNLVVHRDIKPSNVLISADGAPRLLDFGIAKLVGGDDDDEAATRTLLRILTPEYAAPEQLRGEPVTTATDVFGLGALLYELLTGQRPFARRQAWSEQDPAEEARAPSTAAARQARRLQGDLDTIVLKALQWRPADRYASVQHLAEDIARHLSGLPITARRASRWERARKFAARHRVPVVSAALVVMSLLTGLGAAATQARSAARERDIARHEGGRAEQITAFLVDLFETADPMDATVGRGDTLRVRTVLDRGADRIRRDLADRPALQQELLATMGRIYTNLGDFDAAEHLLGEALAAGAGDADPRSHAARVSLLARIALERGEFPRADSLFDIAVTALDALGGAPDSLYVAATTEHGLIRSYLGEYASALELTERALTLAQANDLASGPLGSRVLNNLATVRYDMGEYAVAEPLYRQSLEIEQSYRPARHPSIASLLNNLAASIHYQGRYDQAEPLYLEAIAVARDGLGERHATVGDYLQNLGTLYADQQRLGEAGPLYGEAAEIYEAAFGRRSPRTAMLLRNVALNHYESGAYDEAVLLLREIELSLRDELGADHLYTVAVSAALGRVLTATGEHEEAFTRLSDCIEAYEAMLPEGHFLLETARRDLGAWYARNQQFDLAEPLLLSSHAALVANRGHDSILAVEARAQLRALYEAQGMTERAAEFAP